MKAISNVMGFSLIQLSVTESTQYQNKSELLLDSKCTGSLFIFTDNTFIIDLNELRKRRFQI